MATQTRGGGAGSNVAVGSSSASWSGAGDATGLIGGFSASFNMSAMPSQGKHTSILQLANYGFVYGVPVVIQGISARVRCTKLNSTADVLRFSLLSNAPGQPAVSVYKDLTLVFSVAQIVTLGSGVDLWGAAWNQIQTEWIYVQVQGFGGNPSSSSGQEFRATVDAVELTVHYVSMPSGAAVLGGGGFLVAAGRRVVLGAAGPAGGGALVASSLRTSVASAALGGAGALSAEGEVIVVGGAVEVTWAQLELPGGVPAPVVEGAASLSGAGSLAAVGVIPVGAVVALSGVGALVCAGVSFAVVVGGAGLVASGSLVAVGRVVLPPALVHAVEMEAVDLVVFMESVEAGVTLASVDRVVELL